MTTVVYPSLDVELPDVEAEDNIHDDWPGDSNLKQEINFVQQKVTPEVDIEVVVEDDEDETTHLIHYWAAEHLLLVFLLPLVPGPEPEVYDVPWPASH